MHARSCGDSPVNETAAAEQAVRSLSGILSQLDRIGAYGAGAHVDSAIAALCRQFDLKRNISDPD
jgi:hypothetical protein